LRAALLVTGKAPAPLADLTWRDGINPYTDEQTRSSILRTRDERVAELERWRAGAGKAYRKANGG
jgi:hypothetical protein